MFLGKDIAFCFNLFLFLPLANKLNERAAMFYLCCDRKVLVSKVPFGKKVIVFVNENFLCIL